MTLHLLTIFLSFIVVLHTQLFDPNEIQTDVDNLRAFPNSPFGFNNPRNIETPNLVDYGQQFGDLEISSNQQANGMTIRLYKYFPFYTGKYNYTMISTNGYIGFAHFSDMAHTLTVGSETDWPRQSDPALIAPYLCKQRVDINSAVNSKVYYRLEMRSSTGSSGYKQRSRSPCRGKLPYVQCNAQSDYFLDKMQRILQEGVAGASTFRADAALVVTWENVRPNIGKERLYSTYQLVWLTDAQELLSYTIINYDKLGYDAIDLNGNTVTGRCQAIFNGGNHTGSVMVDLSLTTKERPSSLAERSSVPHIVRGRYLHRVDDIVRPGGCSNKTGGTFPLLIYPNIVDMLGQMTVEVNGMCLNPTITYVLMIEQRATAPCTVINSALARCRLPKILDWGTKTVYFQPQSGLASDEKAYVGYIYFVPPTIDPMRLDIGDIHDWYKNPVQNNKEITWYPRNFTIQESGDHRIDVNNPTLYQLSLGLYVVGYKEARDDKVKKFRPLHRVLARLATYQNSGDEKYRWKPQQEAIRINQLEQWYLDEEEREYELFSYRFGYLKLAPNPTDDSAISDGNVDLPTGLISAPISLHWLWALRYESIVSENAEEMLHQKNFVKKKAAEMCTNWFNEDGALPNFIRETETNSSCPCKEDQAKMDLGRFMPHPRCSTLFRDVTCTEMLGSRNCYLSAQNVRGFHIDENADYRRESSYLTHYGQMCCYDEGGYLMQTSYQPVIKIDDSTPYSPGFPTRAYEFGTTPYQGMFEIPGLSSFHHDLMPYYLCCKYSDFRCQLFYWRRPSSACQQYQPPVIGTILGAGVFTTLQRQKFIFSDPGVFSLFYASRTFSTPEVRIQIRMERFPDRSVDFSGYNQEQFRLVQPSNATVLTGIALESTDSDRVHIILRKDTRRMRYRTTVLVNDIVRYFDDMTLQRFKGVTIYVNNVQRGQSELYVVLDSAQIGMRVRESYGLDMDRIPAYLESFGLLDLLVSVPPQYHVMSGSGSHSSIVPGEVPTVDGLLIPSADVGHMPDPDAPLLWNEVNNEGRRSDLITRYRIKGGAELGLTSSSVRLTNGIAMTDMFENVADSPFSVLPDSNLKKPVYTTDPRYQTGQYAFVPQTEKRIKEFQRICDLYYSGGYPVDPNISPEVKRCPMETTWKDKCGDDVICQFDTLLLQTKLLGEKSKEEFVSFVQQRHMAMLHYNSCGAIALEYPEYMVKGPSSAAAAYLEGDVVSFSCFQDHVSKGDSDYHCVRREYDDNHNSYVMRWNEGVQPWCRSRQKEDFLTWMFWIAVLIGVITSLVIVFVTCWAIKQRQRNNGSYRRDSKSSPRSREIPLQEMSTADEKQPLRPSSHYERNAKHSLQPSLNGSYPAVDHAPQYSRSMTSLNRSTSQPYIHEDIQEMNNAKNVRISSLMEISQCCTTPIKLIGDSGFTFDRTTMFSTPPASRAHLGGRPTRLGASFGLESGV